MPRTRFSRLQEKEEKMEEERNLHNREDENVNRKKFLFYVAEKKDI